jgi:O-acetyl-ADP-ribose deacetylase (regulator of RNase III)
MDGGIDMVYSERLGWHVQERLRALLAREHEGELMVGLAVHVETEDADYPILISAPTMRAPDEVRGTLNAFLAFRAALRCARDLNAEAPGRVGSMLCPGLGTATGGMDPKVCARQMHAAWREVIHGERPDRASVNAVILEHYRLLRAE